MERGSAGAGLERTTSEKWDCYFQVQPSKEGRAHFHSTELKKRGEKMAEALDKTREEKRDTLEQSVPKSAMIEGKKKKKKGG